MIFRSRFSAVVCECGSESLRPASYCPSCGRRSDPLDDSHNLIRRAVSELTEINEILKLEQGRDVRLWDYLISHSELELRFAHHATGVEDEPRHNTVIICADTKRIVCGTRAWPSQLLVDSYEGEYGIRYLLRDTAAGVEIDCGVVAIYELMEAKLFSGLRKLASDGVQT